MIRLSVVTCFALQIRNTSQPITEETTLADLDLDELDILELIICLEMHYAYNIPIYLNTFVWSYQNKSYRQIRELPLSEFCDLVNKKKLDIA